MTIEFRPGLFLRAILGKKSLILKNFPNAKTVVLERFNELFSGKHIITLHEDIYQTFTEDHKKVLCNFNDNFRIIATCQEGYEKRLSEALLSRFTLISVESYTNDEQKRVLYLKIKEKSILEDDVNKLTEYTAKFKKIFPLTKMINCLNIYNEINIKKPNNKKQNLFLSFYMLAKGLLERRDKDNIDELRSIDKDIILRPKDIQNKIQNKSFCPLKKNIKRNEYLESDLSNIFIISSNITIPKNYKEICFTQKCIEILDVLHFGLSTKTPVILEGTPGQGKQTMIKL